MSKLLTNCAGDKLLVNCGGSKLLRACPAPCNPDCNPPLKEVYHVAYDMNFAWYNYWSTNLQERFICPGGQFQSDKGEVDVINSDGGCIWTSADGLSALRWDGRYWHFGRTPWLSTEAGNFSNNEPILGATDCDPTTGWGAGYSEGASGICDENFGCFVQNPPTPGYEWADCGYSISFDNRVTIS